MTPDRKINYLSEKENKKHKTWNLHHDKYTQKNQNTSKRRHKRKEIKIKNTSTRRQKRNEKY